MLSILIPTFNYPIINLVSELHSQLVLARIKFEIICIDDASSNYYLQNDTLKNLKNVSLQKLPKNIGRSKIRNLLASKAIYDWLLFLDADVIPKDKDFINVYLRCIESKDAQVFCGGIAYENKKPEARKMLRWVYGKKREEIDLEIRKRNPYKYFFGANFLIHKSIFETVKFNNQIVKYGYEDVFFVEDMRRNVIMLQHIDNEVYHMGIELSSVFLHKIKQAMENLHHLNSQYVLKSDKIKVLKFYKKVHSYKLNWVFSSVFVVFHKLFEYNLKSRWPSMFILDVYKLTYLFLLDKKKN
ncbi:glycosyltransferase family 2 protein [Lutibacter sp.]